MFDLLLNHNYNFGIIGYLIKTYRNFHLEDKFKRMFSLLSLKILINIVSVSGIELQL